MSRFVKNPDEIVLENVRMVHYETMEEGRAVWLGIYMNDGKMYHMNIGGDNLYVNYSYEGNDPNITEWTTYTDQWNETGQGV